MNYVPMRMSLSRQNKPFLWEFRLNIESTTSLDIVVADISRNLIVNWTGITSHTQKRANTIVSVSNETIMHSPHALPFHQAKSYVSHP